MLPDRTSSSRGPGPEAAARLAVGFVIFQTGNRANGGVESISQVVERVRAVHPVIITQRETPTTARWRRAGLEVHVLESAFESWSEDRPALLHAPRNNLWMAALVHRRRLRVVHVNDIQGWVNLGAGARAGGARLVLNVRDVKPADEAYSVKWRLAASMSDQVVGLSQEMATDVARRLCSRLFFGSPEVSYVYSAVDGEVMKPGTATDRTALRASLGLPAERFVVGYIAAFNAKKAQLAFLEHALPRLVARAPETLVCFVGDFRPDQDPYARRCAEAVARHGLAGHVRFVGYSPQVADWYRAVDILALASRTEGLARCMIEGLACGTPVASFDVCSAREILEAHRCGLVAAQGDHAGLVEAMVELRGAERRAELGANGARVARTLFDPAAGVQRYEALWQAVAERSGG